MDRRALDLLDPRDAAVERIWRSLESHAQPSYFLSWGWMSNWLAALPDDHRPALAVVHDGQQPSAAFFLTQRRVRRNLLLQSNALYFNSTGVPRHDDIEHNGLLAAPGARRSLSSLLDLLPSEWDELHLPAVDRYAFDDLGAPSSPLATRYNIHIEREENAPFVDLEAVRTVDGGYDALLSTSTRTQLHHTRSRFGGLDVEVATDRHQALDIYGELLRLHARHHAQPGERGAFADAWVEAFHRRLILDRLAHGEIQLMRVTSGGTTLGCLYNFVYRGRVIAYQSGLASFDEASLEPGYITHAAAIEYNALAGHSTYDLLASHAEYEESLATGSTRLVWLRVQRPLTRFSFETTAKRWAEIILGERPQLALSRAY